MAALDVLGPYLRTLPDGETGERRNWIISIVEGLRAHPDLELRKPGDWSDYDRRHSCAFVAAGAPTARRWTSDMSPPLPTPTPISSRHELPPDERIWAFSKAFPATSTWRCSPSAL